jgi:predicted RNA-binding Zn ribbon-like protein
MSPTTTAAPGRLELVRAFVNTRDVDQATDEMNDVAGLAGWLVRNGLLEDEEAAGATNADRARAVAVREALRALLLANNDDRPAEASAIAILDEAAVRARVGLRLGADGQAHLEAQAPGVDGAVGRLLVIAYEAMEHGEWRRLKACRNDTCQWGFYDHSKNHSKTWCSMEVCGSQVKSRAYRERKRAGGAAMMPGSSPSPSHSHPVR